MKLKKNLTYQNQECDKYGIFLLSAPRTWGCFHALYFIDWCKERLPHARGDVSTSPPIAIPGIMSAPRTWG